MASVIRDLLEKLWTWISAGAEKVCNMGSWKIRNLVEKVCTWISVGVETIVNYVQEVVKTIPRYVPRLVSQGLTRLKNLWKRLKSSISSAIASTKEKCLEVTWAIMKSVLQGTKFVTAEIVELITNLKNVPKRLSDFVMRKLLERVAGGFGVAVLDADKLILSVSGLVQLSKKRMNAIETRLEGGSEMFDLFQDLITLFGHVVTIIGVIFRDVWNYKEGKKE